MRWLAPQPDRPGLPTSVAPSAATGWIMRHSSSLTEQDAAGFKTVLASCPELQAVHQHVAGFGAMMSNRAGGDLPPGSWRSTATTAFRTMERPSVSAVEANHANTTALFPQVGCVPVCHVSLRGHIR
jgi:hypothetical protein